MAPRNLESLRTATRVLVAVFGLTTALYVFDLANTGWQMTATEITIPAGAPPGRKHRHPGFVIGYVPEGQYSFAVNDRPAAVFNAGQMFFESFDAPGEVHSSSGNASATQPCRFLAIVFTKKGDPITIPG